MKTIQKPYKKNWSIRKRLDKTHRFAGGLVPRMYSREFIKG